MKFVRLFVGQIILFLDFLTRPKGIVRSEQEQERINDITSSMSLYQFKACPFCVKVRRHMWKNSLQIELKDAKNDLKIKEELVRGGGKHKVPCLRIESKTQSTRWLYSSNDICLYLDSELLNIKES